MTKVDQWSKSSFKVSVKNFIEKYDFDKDMDAFPGDAQTGQLKRYACIMESARFLREGSGTTKPVFSSDFFFKETCPASICLLVVTIMHILVLKIDKVSLSLLSPSPSSSPFLSENSVYASVYHCLLGADKPGRFHSINSRKPVDWQDEMPEFATRLLALTGVGEDVEELDDDAINDILFG
ncbi:hypothetical protein BC941DRAFT_476351 [Chlamydoabsidia padenii]|nr:hypothetical protein BC941DRAFT_476351 [Chlamydoabsidia padenii]